MEQYPNLNRLLELRDEGVAPKGRRQRGPVSERSKPTGWETKSGDTTLQELKFSNGYVVMALNVPRQKAVIKGPEAALGFLEAIKRGEVEACISEWLEHLSKELNDIPSGRHVREAKPLSVHTEGEHEEHPDPSQSEEFDSLKADVAEMKSAFAEVLSFVKQQTKSS